MHICRVFVCISIFSLFSVSARAQATAKEDAESITLDNGAMRIVLKKSSGQIIAVHARIKGKLTQISDPKARNALYLDWNGGPEVVPAELKDKQPRAGYGGPSPKRIWIVDAGPDAAEVAVQTDPGEWFPFATEYHYRLPKNERALYAWVQYIHGPGMKAGNIGQTRLVFRGVTGTTLFTHHIVDEKRCKPFPTSPVVEVVQDATTLHQDGTIHTKYDNSAFTADYIAHGLWGQGVGMWVLWPSTEFCNSGPLRQDLTVHDDNVILAMFQSGHYGAGAIRVGDDEQWTKFCGPVVFYVNETVDAPSAFRNAVQRTKLEREQWPYQWLKHDDYPLSRSTVIGTAKRSDGRSAAGAWAVLSPVEAIDWALSAKGYQYFTRVAEDGSFKLPNVRPGKYKLNISGADQPVDYQKEVEVSEGQVELGMLEWTTKQNGQTLWQVGTFDRASAEFMGGDDPRNYARYMDYFKAFPNDVNYIIGKSDPKRDWFYAQWNWYSKKPRWTVQFDSKAYSSGKAMLTVGIASREYASGRPVSDVAERALSSGTLVVRLNGEIIAEFSGPKTGAAGYRSASQDSKYVLESVEFDASKLKAGTNEISFEHAVNRQFPSDPEELKTLRRPRGSVMYDAIRLEVPN